MKNMAAVLLVATVLCASSALYAQHMTRPIPQQGMPHWYEATPKPDALGNKIAKKVFQQTKQAKAKHEAQKILKELDGHNPFSKLEDHESQPVEQNINRNPYFKGGDPHNAANYEKCRLCGEPITDEKLHRKCPQDPDVMCLPAPKDASKDYTCYRCGKSFRPGQHCAKADYNALCAKDKAQEQALEKAEQERQQEAAKASVCPKCGEEYTIDELYHGVQHQCQK